MSNVTHTFPWLVINPILHQWRMLGWHTLEFQCRYPLHVMLILQHTFEEICGDSAASADVGQITTGILMP